MITLCTIYSVVRGIWLEPMPCQISQVSNSPHRFQSCRFIKMTVEEMTQEVSNSPQVPELQRGLSGL